MARKTYTGPVAFRADLNDGRGGYVVLPTEGVQEYEDKQDETYDTVRTEQAKSGRKNRANLRAFNELPLHPHSELGEDHDWDSMPQVVWVPDADGVNGDFELVEDDEDPVLAQQDIYDDHQARQAQA